MSSPDLLTRPEPPAGAPPEARIGLRELFAVFLQAGCAFGGGLSVLGFVQDEFVRRRQLVTEREFVRLFGLSRIVPSGSITALTVSFGYRLGGWGGTVLALTGLMLPGFLSTMALTAAYPWLAAGPVLGLLSAVILPAAVGLLSAAAYNLTRSVVQTKLDVMLAIAALVAALGFDANPSVVLLLGGLVGALAYRPGEGETL